MNLLQTSVLVYVEIYNGSTHDYILKLMLAHGFDEAESLTAIEQIILQRKVDVVDGKLYFIPPKEEIIDPSYLAAADAYRESKRPFWQRILNRIGFHLAFLWVLTWFTVGLCAQEQWTYAEMTAYCPCVICCGNHADGKTANLTDVLSVPYNFAADRKLPLGTRIYVPTGLGVLDNIRSNSRTFVVDDRGGALDTEAKKYGVLRLDLRVRDHWWAMKFGRKIVPVLIYKETK